MADQKCVWPGGDDKPVCMLRYSHQEFSKKTGLVFENGMDDLDKYFGGFLVDSKLGPLKFLEYVNAPASGITVYVDSLVKTSHAVRAIKKRFNLTDADISWVREIGD